MDTPALHRYVVKMGISNATDLKFLKELAKRMGWTFEHVRRTELDEAIEVMRAEKRSGKILTIGFQPRMSENMQMIKKIVQSGELGKVYYIQAGGGRRRGIPTPFGTSFIEKETGGIGAVGDIGTYSLDMLLGAVGYPKPLTVSGYTSSFFGKDPGYYDGHPEYAEKFGVDDFAAAFVRLEGDIILDFRLNYVKRHLKDLRTELLSTKDSSRMMEIMAEIKKMQEVRNILAQKLGSDIVV